MSPEQFHNKAITGASDQYSLGVVAYEMLLGRKPFDGATYAEIITQHLFEQPGDIRAARPDVPEHIAGAIMRMLAKDPAERFPDLDAVAHELGVPQKTDGVVVRTEMISLAKNGPQKKVRMSVPISPVPMTKRNADPAAPTVVEKPARTRAARPAGASSSKSRSPMIAAAALILLGGGGFAAWKTFGAQTSQTQPPQHVAAQPSTTDSTARAALVIPTGTPTTPPAASRDSAPASSQAATKEPPPSTKQAETKVASPQTRTPTTRSQPRAERSASTSAPRQTSAPPPASEPTRTAESGLATLQLRISPPGHLYVDNISKGERSSFAEQLIPGTHTLRIERDGYETKDTTVVVTAARPTTIRITLTPRQ
jgi:serine/threonine-protein kinase